MTEIILLVQAELDIEEAMDWYAERSARAAAGFMKALEAALERIAEQPESFARLEDGNRYCPLRKYPFSVIYRVVHSDVHVAAVAHNSKLPYW